jgi:purine nucleosidase
MGIPQRDIDDGLTILYLIGSCDVNLKGITTTFGNHTIDVVYDATKNLINDMGYNQVDILKGGTADHRKTGAACFMAEMVDAHRGDITILATGALTNVYGAYLVDKQFFQKVGKIIVMGGTTEKMLINGYEVGELNFSCDPEATYHVLSSVAPTTVITGNLCLQAFFGEEELNRIQIKKNIGVYGYMYSRMVPWIEFMQEIFKIEGFYNWDMVAAVYATHPQLFDDNGFKTTSTVSDLRSGILKKSLDKDGGYDVNIPTDIKDLQKFNDTVFNAWDNVKMPDK